MLKNPNAIYEEFKDSDIIAGRGLFPEPLSRKWGATISGGVFMIRSTPKSGNIFRLG